MSSTPHFAYADTSKPDGFYVQFERCLLNDEDAHPSEYLFQDPDYAKEDQARLDAFNNGDWHMIGVRAKALCLIVRNGVGTYINLDSPGCWAIESDSDEEFLTSVYEDEEHTLLALIEEMKNPIFETD